MTTFTEWLDRQQRREDDQVGALARGIAEHGSDALDLEKRSVREAVRAAWDEYEEAVPWEDETEAPSAVGARG